MFSNRTQLLTPHFFWQCLWPQGNPLGNTFLWITLQVRLCLSLHFPCQGCGVSPGTGTHMCTPGFQQGICVPSPDCHKSGSCLWWVRWLCSDPQIFKGPSLEGECMGTVVDAPTDVGALLHREHTLLYIPPPASGCGGMSHSKGRFQTCHNN